MNTKYDEARALRLLSQGSEEGFRMIYERYGPAVLRVGKKFLHAQESAEDLLQEVFSRIWVHPERFCKVDNLEAYLFIVTKNLCIRKLKKLHHEKIVEAEYAKQKASVGNCVEDFIRDKEYEGLVQQAIDNLPPQRKRVYTLVRSEGLSHDAVAHQLQLSASTVNNYVVLADEHIKNHVLRHIAFLAWFCCIVF
jgi:RNA polymerase sigma-70 factor (family 1)